MAEAAAGKPNISGTSQAGRFLFFNPPLHATACEIAYPHRKIDAVKEKNSEHFDLYIRLKIRKRHAIAPKSTDACMDML